MTYTVESRVAAEIGREFAEPEDRKYARKVARHLLGIDPRPVGPEDEVVVDEVKRRLHRLGYARSAGGFYRSTLMDGMSNHR